MNIDWKRIAKPQPDGYDIEVMGTFLKEKYGWIKTKPSTEHTFCDGNVALGVCPFYPRISDVMNNDPFTVNRAKYHAALSAVDLWSNKTAEELEVYLRQWDGGYTTIKSFVDVFWPLVTFRPYTSNFNIETGYPDNELFEIKNSTLEKIAAAHKHFNIHSRGSMSGHYNPEHHTPIFDPYVNGVYVTIDNMQGCAEGIFHEIGHLRLNALNLEIEKHDYRFFTNTPENLYESPIRRDKKRPLSAVIQAIYSWLMLSENDLQCANIQGNAMVSATYLITNFPKIEDGLIIIRNNIKCTPEGIDFIDGYLEWGEDICSRARELCKQQFAETYTDRYNKACEYKIIQKVPE